MIGYSVSSTLIDSGMRPGRTNEVFAPLQNNVGHKAFIKTVLDLIECVVAALGIFLYLRRDVMKRDIAQARIHS